MEKLKVSILGREFRLFIDKYTWSGKLGYWGNTFNKFDGWRKLRIGKFEFTFTYGSVCAHRFSTYSYTTKDVRVNGIIETQYARRNMRCRCGAAETLLGE